MAVCEKTFRLYSSLPYADQIIGGEPRVSVEAADAPLFDYRRNARRHPKESKGEDYAATVEPAENCCC